MKTLRTRVLFTFACATFAACSSTASTPLAPVRAPATATPTARAATPTPTASPAPATATPTPSQAPTSNATTVPLNNGAPVVNAPVSTALPAPAGYSQSVTVPLVNAPANTTVQLVSGPAPPPALAPLKRLRSAYGRFDTTGSYNVILYDTLVPSANITVAGNISFTQGFPAGVLGASTQYYLGFYDSTQASPAWQTIAGPVTANGGNLTFSGTISSLTLTANSLYGFAVFSSVSPTGTPPPAPQTLVYYGNESALTIAAEDGTVASTLPIGSDSFDLDDAGNVYAALNGEPTTLTKYPAGSASPSATYQPSVDANAFIAASGSGEVAAVYIQGGAPTQTTDVWDPGQTGPPSRTLTTAAAADTFFAMTHDGTLYLPDVSPSGVPEYDVFPPGASNPSRVITETIVPPAQYASFAPNYAAVGPDGTFYATEYDFAQPDPNAGLYIYPGNGGPESFIPAQADANGAGPQGVDVDGSGNIYVVNNNSGFTPSGCQGDSLQDVTVYSPSGTLLRTIAGGNSGFPITVAADGTAFFASFMVQFSQSCTATGAYGIYAAAPGATTSTQIAAVGSTEIVLFDGTHKSIPFYTGHGAAGYSHGGARGGMFHRRNRR